MKYYTFTLTIGAEAETPEEAWNEAVSALCDDPGEWDSYTEEELED